MLRQRLVFKSTHLRLVVVQTFKRSVHGSSKSTAIRRLRAGLDEGIILSLAKGPFVCAVADYEAKNRRGFYRTSYSRAFERAAGGRFCCLLKGKCRARNG